MMHRTASLGAGLAVLVLALSGCFTQPQDGVFGPANSLGGAENNSPALSLQASPARGPGPLEVEFSLSALDRDGGSLTWSLDFGDRTAPAAGGELPTRPRHTYQAPGAYLATFKVVDGGAEAESFVSTISIVVLEGIVPDGEPTQGPEEPDYSPPRSGGGGGGGGGSDPSHSETSTTTSSGNGTSSETGTTTEPPSNTSSSSSESSTTATESPTSSETSSSSQSQTETTSSTGTETFSDPNTSTSNTSTSSEPEPEPTSSETQSSTDPPL